MVEIIVALVLIGVASVLFTTAVVYAIDAYYEYQLHDERSKYIDSGLAIKELELKTYSPFTKSYKTRHDAMWRWYLNDEGQLACELKPITVKAKKPKKKKVVKNAKSKRSRNSKKNSSPVRTKRQKP